MIRKAQSEWLFHGWEEGIIFLLLKIPFGGDGNSGGGDGGSGGGGEGG